MKIGINMALGMLGGGAVIDPIAQNLPAAIASFKAAAVGGVNRLLLYVIGASIGVGYNATGVTDAGGANSWASLLNTYLQGQYGSGSQLILPNSAEFVETGTWVNSNNGNTFTGGWAAGTGRMSSVLNSTKSITKTCTRFDLYYFNHPAGAFKVSIDGGAEITITTGAGASACQTFSGLSLAEHTLTIRVPADGTYAWINGVDCSIGSGISIFNQSSGSSKIINHQTTGQPLSGLGAIPSDVKILFILSLTTNDYGGQTAINTFTSQTTTLLDTLKARGDVILISENWQTQQLTIPQSSYDAVYAGLASGNVGCIQIFKKWGSAAEAISTGYVTETSGVHPNSTGHIDYKDVIIAKTGL